VRLVRFGLVAFWLVIYGLDCIKCRLGKQLWPGAWQYVKIPLFINLNIMEVKDSNGNLLVEGDSVCLVRDLTLKGSSTTFKRGTKIKNIRLTDDEEEVECRVGKGTIVLKTCFLKKV